MKNWSRPPASKSTLLKFWPTEHAIRSDRLCISIRRRRLWQHMNSNLSPFIIKLCQHLRLINFFNLKEWVSHTNIHKLSKAWYWISKHPWWWWRGTRWNHRARSTMSTDTLRACNHHSAYSPTQSVRDLGTQMREWSVRRATRHPATNLQTRKDSACCQKHRAAAWTRTSSCSTISSHSRRSSALEMMPNSLCSRSRRHWISSMLMGTYSWNTLTASRSKMNHKDAARPQPERERLEAQRTTQHAHHQKEQMDCHFRRQLVSLRSKQLRQVQIFCQTSKTNFLIFKTNLWLGWRVKSNLA